MEEITYQFGATIGIRKYIREMLNADAFYFGRIRWRETKGFFSSLFYIRGPVEDIYNLSIRLKEAGAIKPPSQRRSEKAAV